MFIYFRNKLTFLLYKNKFKIMTEFHRTARGQKFYDKDLPQLVKALSRVGDLLEKLNEREDRKFRLDEKLKRMEIREQNGSGTK